MALLLNGSSANMGGLRPGRTAPGLAEDGTTLIRENLEGQILEFLDIDWTAGGDNKSVRTGRTNLYKVVRANAILVAPAMKPVINDITHAAGLEYRSGTWIGAFASDATVPAMIVDEWLVGDLAVGDLFLVIVRGMTKAVVGTSLGPGVACGVTGAGVIGPITLTATSGAANLAAHQIGYGMDVAGTGNKLIEVGSQIGL